MNLKTSRPVCEHCGYNENTNNAPHQLPVGTMLNNQYMVGRVLGQGGFGITYLGWDMHLDTPIAIKEYYPNNFVTRDTAYSLEVSGFEGHKKDLFYSSRERFLREAKALARFTDVPEIVRVHNFFECNNTAYIIMEYIHGIDLKRYIARRGGKLSVEETFTILKPVIEAVSIVHKAGLVHRDISPDNIMMLSKTRAKLLDFGAVRDVGEADADKELSKSTEAILKHGFAPMEQYQKRGSLGPWTDVYALCATIYYCLTGQLPPDAPARMLEDVHPDWRSIPGLTDHQVAVLEKGMAMRAKDRIASVDDLYALLFGGRTLPVEEPTPVPLTDIPSDDPTGKTQPIHTVPVNADPAVTVPPSYTPPQSDPSVVIAPSRNGKRTSALLTAILVICAAAAAVFYFFTQPGSQPDPSLNTPGLVSSERISSSTEAPATEESTMPTIPTTEAPTETTTEPPVTEAPTEEPTEETAEVSPIKVATPTWNYDDNAYVQNVLLGSDNPGTSDDFGTYSVFRSAIHRNQICSITFLDNIAEAPANCWDVSRGQNRSVLAWVEENGDYYDLYIGAAGGVNASACCSYLFAGYRNVKTIDFGVSFHMTGSPNLSYMFYQCESLEYVDVSGFDTSTVMYMENMFNGCRSLKYLDVSGFDTAKVTNFNAMFTGCSNLKSLDVSGFNTSGCLNTSWMFSGCVNVGTLDVSGFDTSRVTDMSGMFNSCTTVKKLDVSGFDTSNVTNMNWMFNGCRCVNELDVSSFKTVHVLYMGRMFSGCSSLETLDISNFDTRNVRSMSWMFSECSKLKELNLDGLVTSMVTTTEGMFSDCSSLTELDISSMGTECVTNMAYMFNNCSSLKELDVSRLSTVNVTSMENMFNNCSSLTELDVSNFFTSNVTNMTRMFYDCTAKITFNFNKFVTRQVMEFQHFMNNKAIVNGKYWEELFKK